MSACYTQMIKVHQLDCSGLLSSVVSSLSRKEDNLHALYGKRWSCSQSANTDFQIGPAINAR